MAEAAKSLKVFVSYSRTDVEFADQLVLALEDRGFEPILDRHDMSGGENWRERLGKLILSADAVTFILTEKSAASEICAWEVEEAQRLGKRILPVTYGSVAGVNPPKALSDLNWIPFWADPAIPGAGFYYGVKRLIEALSVDLDWLRAQTRYSERASEWAKGGREEDLLLRGEALKDAHAWLGRTPPGSSPPDGVREYLSASSDAEQRRDAVAKAQLNEREQAVKMAEAAVAEKQAAVAEKAKTDRRLRLLAVLALVVGIGLVGTAAAGLWYAGVKAGEAGDRRAALFAQAGLELCQEGNCDAGMLVAVAGDPAAKESVFETALRPDGYPALRTALTQFYADDRLVYANRTNQQAVALAAFPDGKRFATFHYDHSVRIWQADKPEPIKTFSLPARVLQAIVLKDGARMLIRWDAYDLPVALWDLSQNQQIREYAATGATSVALDPAEKTLLIGGPDGSIEIWPLSGTERREIVKTVAPGEYKPSMRSVVFSGDGQWFAGGDDEGVVTVWPASGGVPKATVSTKTNGVNTLLFVPPSLIDDEGQVLIGGSGDGRLLSLEARDGSASESLPGFSAKTGQDAISVTDLALDPDRGVLLMQSTGARATLLRLDGAAPSSLLDDREGMAGALMMPEANAFVTVSTAGVVSVWKFEAAERSAKLVAGFDTVQDTVVTPDGSVLLAFGRNSTFSLWRPGDTKPFRTWTQDLNDSTGEFWSGIALSPDGKLALAKDSWRKVTVWDVRTGGVVQTLPPVENVGVNTVAFLPDSSGFVIVTESVEDLSLEAPQTPRLAFEVWKSGSDKPSLRSEGTSEVSQVRAVAIHPDGQQLLVAGLMGVELWRLGETRPTAFFQSRGAESVAWHPDGRRFAVGLDTGEVQLRQVDATEPDQIFTGHTDQVMSIAFNAAGDRMLTTANDATARLWELGQRTHLQKFEGFDSAVLRAWFEADGAHVGTASSRAISRWKVDPIMNETAQEQTRMVCERLAERGQDEIWPELRRRYPILDERISDRPCEAMGLVRAKPRPKPDVAKPALEKPAANAVSAPG
jgi:WD40 repeat protein